MRRSQPKAQNNWQRTARGLLALGISLLATGIVVAASSVVFAGSAGAESRGDVATKVAGGHLAWNPVGSGGDEPSIEVGDGASVGRDGTLRFPVSGGVYDTAGGTGTVEHRGTAVLVYPDGAVTALADPTVEMDRSEAVLWADVHVGSADDAGEEAARRAKGEPRRKIGTLKTYGIAPEAAERSLTWTDVPTTLTAAGAEALPGTSEGAETDPVTLSLGLTAANSPALRAATAGPTATSTATGTESPDPTGDPAPTDCPSTTPPASEAASADPSPTGTAGESPSEDPSPTATGTEPGSPSPTATTSGCPTDPPGAGDGDGDNDPLGNGGGNGSGGGSGGGSDDGSGSGGEGLAKTGGALIPLMALGGILTVAGGGTMLLARRRAALALRS